MDNTVFVIVAGGIGILTIANLFYVRPDVVASLKNNPERVDYFQKAQNSTAKKVNRTALFSYFKPAFEKQNWTQSKTKADRSKILTKSHSADPGERAKAVKYIATHKLRTGSGKTGPTPRIYNYYG